MYVSHLLPEQIIATRPLKPVYSHLSKHNKPPFPRPRRLP